MMTSIHLSYVLGTLPLRDRFATAKRLGFDAVEYPFPYHLSARTYARLLEDNGLRQISIGAPASDYKNGAPGFSLTPALQSQFDRSIDTAIEYAKAIRCRNVHVFAGPKASDVSFELAFETYCLNLGQAFDRLRQEDLNLVIEAINSVEFPGYFIDRLDRALAAVEHTGCEGIGVILDIYHAYMNKEDPIGFIRSHFERVAHIQLADYPGRHEPGTGNIDFNALFRSVHEIGYAGSIGLEYIPTRTVLKGVPLSDFLFGKQRKPCVAETDRASRRRAPPSGKI